MSNNSTQPLRVAHVFAWTEGGSWVFDQLRALRDDQGYEVFAVLGGEVGSLAEKCRAAGIRVRALDFAMGNPLTLPWRILALALWLRRERIDVVQSHVMLSSMFARPAAWLADVPVRLTMVTGPYYMQSPAFRGAELRTCGLDTGIIPSCDLSARLYRQAGVAERLVCETLYYGPAAALWNPAKASPLGLRAQFGLGEGTLLIGSVAHFYPRLPIDGNQAPPHLRGRLAKGHEDLIAAMPAILEEFPTAKMLFIGKGWGPHGQAAEAELKELVAASGMDDHVLFTGFVTDVAGAYLDIDVSVQASLDENLGGTIESLLMARPTVATRVGGMVDAIIDGETGVLVEPSDPLDLARGIRELLRDPVRARRLGEAGRRKMLAGFTLDVTAPRLAALYRRQREAAPGAWRLSRFAGRLLVAPLLFLPTAAGMARFIGTAMMRRLRRIAHRPRRAG